MAAKTKDDGLKVYYYDAVILRENERGRRQGTLKSMSPKTAMDTLMALSTNSWKRPLVKVTMYEVDDAGESHFVMTSTIGEDHERDIKPVPPRTKPANDCSNPPWSPPEQKTFWPVQIGQYYQPETFALFQLKDT